MVGRMEARAGAREQDPLRAPDAAAAASTGAVSARMRASSEGCEAIVSCIAEVSAGILSEYGTGSNPARERVDERDVRDGAAVEPGAAARAHAARRSTRTARAARPSRHQIALFVAAGRAGDLALPADGPYDDEAAFAASSRRSAAIRGSALLRDRRPARRARRRHGELPAHHARARRDRDRPHLVRPALQRTREATEAIYLLARHAFDDLGYRRFEWKCNALNAPSRRAADRFGFTFEGIFRKHRSSRAATATRPGTRSSTTSGRRSAPRSRPGSTTQLRRGRPPATAALRAARRRRLTSASAPAAAFRRKVRRNRARMREVTFVTKGDPVRAHVPAARGRFPRWVGSPRPAPCPG